jgi:hypothetical protein
MAYRETSDDEGSSDEQSSEDSRKRHIKSNVGLENNEAARTPGHHPPSASSEDHQDVRAYISELRIRWIAGSCLFPNALICCMPDYGLCASIKDIYVIGLLKSL